MSLPRPTVGWLRGLSSPLVLLTLLAACVGLLALKHETKLAVERAEAEAVQQVAGELAQLQVTMEALLEEGHREAVHELLANLGSDPRRLMGLLLDEERNVLASIRPGPPDTPAHELWQELNVPEQLARMQRAREQHTGIVELSADRQRVIGYHPVHLGSGPDSQRTGVLVFQHDLSKRVRDSRQEAQQRVLRSTGVMLVLAGGLGLVLQFFLGRRVRRLATTIQEMIDKIPGAQRAEQRSVDALGKLDDAFHQIAEQIGRSRARLEENEERFQTIIERSPEATFIHWEGHVVFNNPAAATLLGYEQAMELQGRRIEELIAPEDLPLLTDPAAEGVPREAHWMHRSGRKVLGEVVTFPMLFERQRVRVSIVRDITERKQLQQKLDTADRMASLGTLAAGVAHEINNPLAFMQSNVRFALEELRSLSGEPDPPLRQRLQEVQEALEETLAGGDRVSDIVRDLKTFSRGDDGGRGAVNVHAVLDLCANIARNQLRHHAKLVKDYGELPPLQANESRLAQLFLNLIINAAQAIPEGGDVNANEVRITTRQEESWVVVEIKDTGVGISPENLHRLFDPFFTTKPVGVGTGLGLSICHGIVSGMGGRMTVDSEPGRGTTFRVFLPVGSP